MEDVDDIISGDGSGGLFSRTATENAQIVKPGSARMTDSMWAVSANESSDQGHGQEGGASRHDAQAEASGGGAHGSSGAHGPGSTGASSGADDLWDTTTDADSTLPPFPPPPFGRPYSSPLGDSTIGGTFTTAGMDAGDAEIFDGAIVDDTVEDPEPDNDEEFVHFTTGGRDGGGYEDPWDQNPGAWDADLDDDLFDPGPSQRMGSEPPYDSLGSLFRSDPVDRHGDVVNQPDDDFDDDPLFGHSARSLFSSGSRPDRGRSGPLRSPSAEADDLFQPPPASFRSASQVRTTSTRVTPPRQHRDEAVPEERVERESEAESPGLLDAVSHLSASDRDRASVPILIAGALLDSDEQVLGLVVGQMLGSSAVMMLTDCRILVVNDRRWQPVVDRYALDDRLEIRGRHDRSVAAIGLGDGESLSMIDGIYDTSAAMSLVAQVRAMVGQVD